jgi:DNA primase
MGLIPEEVIGEIRQRVDIVAVIGQHVSLRKAGRNHKGLCPFHHERTPSFNVNGDKGFFYCFGCQKKGDVFTFLMEYEGKSFVEAAEALAARTGVEIPAPISGPAHAERRSERARLVQVNDLAACYFAEQLAAEEGARARAYLEERGIGSEVAERFRLGFAPGGWRGLADYLAARDVPMDVAEKAGLVARQPRAGGFYDRFRDRLMCPIFTTSGEVVAFSGRLLEGGEAEAGRDGREEGGAGVAKYINSPESPVYRKSKMLFGLYQARDGMRAAGRAILVEGNFDVLALHQVGFAEAVAPLGTALTAEQAEALRRLGGRVLLLFDGDRAGRAATLTSLETLVAADVEVQIATLPAGEDPDSLVRSGGREALAGYVDRARPGVEFFIHEVWSSAVRSADGQAAAFREAAGVLRSVADPTKRDLLVGTFASALGVDEGTLRRGLRRALQGQATEIRQDPPKPLATSPAPRYELDLVALLCDHPHLVENAEEQAVLSLLTDSRLRDMYSAAREGRSPLEVAPEDPTIARHVLAGHFADVQNPSRALDEIVANLRRVPVKTRLAESRPSLDREIERRRLLEIVTTRKQVD